MKFLIFIPFLVISTPLFASGNAIEKYISLFTGYCNHADSRGSVFLRLIDNKDYSLSTEPPYYFSLKGKYADFSITPAMDKCWVDVGESTIGKNVDPFLAAVIHNFSDRGYVVLENKKESENGGIFITIILKNKQSKTVELAFTKFYKELGVVSLGGEYTTKPASNDGVPESVIMAEMAIDQLKGKLVSTISGSTFLLNDERRGEIIVRIHGIKTDPVDTYCGKKAKSYLNDALKNEIIYVEIKKVLSVSEVQGALLLKSKRFTSSTLVSEGLAEIDSASVNNQLDFVTFSLSSKYGRKPKCVNPG